MSYTDDTKVSEILKRKRGSIKQAPLPEGAPGWDEIVNCTWGEIEERERQNLPGYRTIKKLLQKKEYDR